MGLPTRRASLCLIIYYLFYAVSYASDISTLAVSVNPYLKRENGKATRLILEPGTLLKILEKKNISGRLAYLVRTPSGIEGIMNASDIHVYTTIPKYFAYVRTESFKLTSEEIDRWVTPGEFFPATVDSNYDLKAITIGRAVYNVDKNQYELIIKDINIINNEDEKFNIISQGEKDTTSFLRWEQIKLGTMSGDTEEWGCGTTIKISKEISSKIQAALGTNFSLIDWLKVKFTGEIDTHAGIESITIKGDNSYKHKFTLWRLADEKGVTLLLTAVEKICPCDHTGTAKIDYVFSFPDGKFDDVDISHKWAQDKGLRSGGISPIKISGLKEYFEYKKNLLDHFNFLSGDYEDAIKDFIIYIAVTIN